jgi:hypothetical protein
MATLADSLVTSITNNYGGTGGGGATPANIVNLNAYMASSAFHSGVEWVVVYIPQPAKRVPFNDNFANITEELKVFVSTATSDDRLKEIKDEVISVINNYAITGVNAQWVHTEEDISDRREQVYMLEITAFFLTLLAQSEVAYAAITAAHNHDGRYPLLATYDAHRHNTHTLQHDGVNSDGGAFSFTTTGAVTFNQDIYAQSDIQITGELVFPSATIHSSGSDIHIHPNIGNTIGNLYLHPSGTEDQSCLHLRTSTSANYGQFSVDIDDTIASLQSSQGGSGTAPTTLNINDGDWAAINIGDAGCVVSSGGNTTVGAGTNNTVGFTIRGTSNGKIEFTDGTGTSSKHLAQMIMYGDSDGVGDKISGLLDIRADHDSNASSTTPIVNFRASNAGAAFATKDLLFRWYNWTTTLLSLDKSGDLITAGDLTVLGGDIYGASGGGDLRLRANDDMHFYVNENVVSAVALTLRQDKVALFTGDIYASYGAIYSQEDNKGLYTGNGNESRIYHDGTHSYWTTTTGDIYIQPTGGDTLFTGNVSVSGYLALTGDLDLSGNVDCPDNVFRLKCAADTVAYVDATEVDGSGNTSASAFSVHRIYYVDACAASALSLKENVEYLDGQLAVEFDKLKPASYNLIKYPEVTRIGFIADDLPEDIKVRDPDGTLTGYYPDRVVAVMVDKIKQLETRIKVLEGK